MATNTENVAEEIQNEEVVQSQNENLSHSHETQEPPSQSNDDDKEYNFRQLREGKKQLEEEVNRLRDEIRAISQKQTPSSEESFEIGDDDIVEGRHVKKLYSRLENLIKQKEAASIPDRLSNRFSDFNQVVTKENIEKLKTLEPEIYTSITSGEDLFSKGVSAYKTLKALGIYKESQDFSAEKEQVRNNSKKPMSVQAVKGQGALHEANVFANGLTPDLKKQLHKEMVEASKAH